MKSSLLPYQLAYLKDQRRRKVWVASRRIGKSFTVALEATLLASMGEGPDNLIVSHDQEASSDVLRYAKSWARWLAKLGIQGARPMEGGRDTATTLEVASGCRVVAIPGGRPEAIRHYGGNTWLDEASHQKRFRANFQAAGPVISQAEGVLRVVSSAFSDADGFWEIFSNRDSIYEDWGRHTTTIHDAIKAGLKTRKGNPYNLEELRKDVPDPDAFGAEFECRPMSDAESFFTWDTLDRCGAVPKLEQGTKYGGFDVARSKKGDLAAICEVVRDGDRYSATETIWAERGVEFEAMEDLAARLFKERGWARMAIDETGLGMMIAERLRKRLGGPAVVDCVTMNPQTKADMMTHLRSLADQGKLHIPADRELRLDLHGIKRIVGDNSIRYDADRNERGHADRAWALALAVRAAGREPLKVEYGYRAVKSRGRRWK